MNSMPAGRSVALRPLHCTTVSPTEVRSRTASPSLRPIHVMSSAFISTVEVTPRYSSLSLPALKDAPCLLVLPATSSMVSAMCRQTLRLGIPGRPDVSSHHPRVDRHLCRDIALGFRLFRLIRGGVGWESASATFSAPQTLF